MIYGLHHDVICIFLFPVQTMLGHDRSGTRIVLEVVSWALAYKGKGSLGILSVIVVCDNDLTNS